MLTLAPAREASTQSAAPGENDSNEGGSRDVKQRRKLGYWLNDLYAQKAESIQRLAYLLVGDRETASDITQEAFIRFMSRMQFMRDKSRGEAFLRKTTVNLCKDYHRSRPRMPLLTRTGEMPDTETTKTPNVATATWIKDLILLLPYRQRAVIILRFHLDLSLSETAEILNCSISAAKSLQVRALSSLRSHMEEQS